MRQISMTELTDIKGIGPSRAETLAENGYETVEDLAEAEPDAIESVGRISEEKALEFVVGAENLLEESEVETEPEDEGDEFDLTPAEVADAAESDSDEEEDADDSDEEESDENPSDDAESESEDDVYTVELSFQSQREFDTFHAALMRHHERVYTSSQPASDVMYSVLEQLYGNEDSVTLELGEFGLNTLHTAIKQQRTSYQGDNLIDHMDELKRVEQAINDIRREKLF